MKRREFEIRTEEEYHAVMDAVSRYRIELYSGLKNPVGSYWRKTTRRDRLETHDYYHVYLTEKGPRLLCISDFGGVSISSDRTIANLQATDDPNVLLQCVSQRTFVAETSAIMSAIGLRWTAGALYTS